MFVTIVLGIINIAAKYKLYEKAGEEGWKALVPFLSKLTFCRLFTGKSGKAWALTNIISGLLAFILIMAEALYPLAFLSLFVWCLTAAKTNIDLGKSFHKKDLFLAGLVFLSGIFIPELAFNKNDLYYGPTGNADYNGTLMNDGGFYPNPGIGMNCSGNEYNASEFNSGFQQQNNNYAYQNQYGNYQQNEYYARNPYPQNGYGPQNPYQQNGYGPQNAYQQNGYGSQNPYPQNEYGAQNPYPQNEFNGQDPYLQNGQNGYGSPGSAPSEDNPINKYYQNYNQ